ncbi:MAG: ABC transporter permease, partial [Planctomycetaceae bacterium]|nr:ABC transporter permease [Planctomycetaceae bacterium]
MMGNDQTPSPSLHSTGRPGHWKQLLQQYLGMLLVLGVVITIFASLNSNLLSWDTFRTVLSQIPVITLLATAMTLVLIVGGIDLSVGSVLALCSCVYALSIRSLELHPMLAIALAVIVGVLAGLLNGTISVYAGIPSFIVTLGMMQVARGS